MFNKKVAYQKTLSICFVVLLVTNILLTFQGLKRLESYQNQQKSLPCQAVPILFVMEEPECANKLLRSMNVTNVCISSIDTSDSPLNQKSILRLQNRSE